VNPLQALRSPEHSLLCSPIGLQVIDSFTNAAPLAPFRARVDVQVGTAWLETLLRPTHTPSKIRGRAPERTSGLARTSFVSKRTAPSWIRLHRRWSPGSLASELNKGRPHLRRCIKSISTTHRKADLFDPTTDLLVRALLRLAREPSRTDNKPSQPEGS
jgi:hypothetical protein